MITSRSYLDHAATTPLRAEAIAAITAELTRVGNPSSLHTSGREARRVVEESRESVASCLGADPAEVIFTSGATEADNLAIKGAFRAHPDAPVLITSTVEHHAVLESVESVASDGATVVLIAVDHDGRVDLDQLRAALAGHAEQIALVSIMYANNETGVLAPVAEITAAARTAGVPVHSDAVQAVGHTVIDFAGSGLDALSLSAHKFGGPVGAGALLARRDFRLSPVQHGGGQERDVRSGTLDVAGIAGMAAALRAAVDELTRESDRIRTLRNRLIDTVLTTIDGTELNGIRDPAGSLPGIANLSFGGCSADNLLMLLDQHGIDSSTGSACTAGVSEPSHVLEAMGRTRIQARSSLRFSLGHTSTDVDVDRLLAVLPGAVELARRAG
ncbi:cysteine desulfurase family protein [Microlunatus endophyticus]|uniref:cysteine desulfurase family protein n=1 Tax=Microlunatus endophyticus TaxID=1716077 RepID=UPI0027E575A9|nr:cysteine desulfurase family protein [Microlunatus endophyticus]